ncbi:NACHT domain-containing protein [Streptomyces lancefieldiae]|uniref:NACHT domain-containing protein n=1 Tax=Streptomyces lancefieldiae TaxID=3075520 RepID=A0ABU3B0D2_9ACTN|nr:NACHT domain-containing protein [Streptomyces sp. DSM 40712]MDT0615907.1 NACHT domain-containing protein [Streptomyces sp. DSM 40712]
MAEQARGDVHNVFSGGSATYVIQGRDFGAVHLRLPSPRTSQERASVELARVVLAQWRDEAGALGLTGSARLAVGWRTDWTVADHREHIGADVTGDTAGLAELAAAFQALPAQRLVIIGGPGTGKTSLAILLTLQLLSRHDATKPVPVPLLVSSWDANKEHFDVWLARRIHEEYVGLTRDLDRARIHELVRDRRILPVLDGLDELPRTLRSAALAGLNRTGADGTPLILTSRTAEYTELVTADTVLQAAAVIRAQPVEGAAAAEYLRGSSHPQRTQRWQVLLDHITHHPEAASAAALSSPLMLWLARTVYAHPDADPGELADESRFPDVVTIERHLIDAIVPAAFPSGPASPHQPRPIREWGHAQAQSALDFLAVHLTAARTKEFAWWELHRAKAPTLLKAPALLAGYVLLMAGSAWFQDWFTGGDAFQAFQVAAGATVAMIFGVAGGLLLSFSQVRKGPLPRRLAAFGRHRSRIPGLFWLLVFLAPIGLLLARDEPLVALGFVVPPLLMMVVGAPADTAQAVGPRQLLRGERASTVLMLLGVAPVIGAIGTLTAVQVPDRAVLLGSWLCGTAVVAAVLLALSPWTQWLLAKVTLAGLGRLPWSTMAFLEDARRVGLLRQVGGVYQFRHAQLQARLAAHLRGGAPARRLRAANRAPWPVRPLPAASSTPQSVRIPGYVGPRRTRGQPALYVMMWTLALLWTGIITFQYSWHDPGAWQTVGFFVALPPVLDLLVPPLTWRRAELRLDEDGVEVASGKRTTRFEWCDIAEVAPHRFELPLDKNDDGSVMLHLRLTPEATPGPGIRLDGKRWVALWPLDSPTGDPDDATPPPELHDALVRFAGERWRPEVGRRRTGY